MPVPSPRNKILPARGNYSDLLANVASLLDGEMCYAIDQDIYYQKEGSALVLVGATKSQGALADSAIQSGDNISELTNDAGYITLAQVPAADVTSVNTQTGDVVLGFADVGAASAAQGTLADSATQPGDNVSTLTNDAGYITLAEVPPGGVTSVNTQTGDVVLDADDIDDTATTHKFATAAQLTNADTAVQPGDNVSTLVNDTGYITLAEVPVSSINDLSDVDTATTAPTDGQALVWDNASSEWIPGDVAADLATVSIDALSDVDTTTVPPASSQVLAWNGANWVPANQSGGGGVSNGAVLISNSEWQQGFLNLQTLNVPFGADSAVGDLIVVSVTGRAGGDPNAIKDLVVPAGWTRPATQDYVSSTTTGDAQQNIIYKYLDSADILNGSVNIEMVSGDASDDWYFTSAVFRNAIFSAANIVSTTSVGAIPSSGYNYVGIAAPVGGFNLVTATNVFAYSPNSGVYVDPAPGTDLAWLNGSVNNDGYEVGIIRRVSLLLGTEDLSFNIKALNASGVAASLTDGFHIMVVTIGPGSGSGGAVDSVNSQIGVVVLDTDDISQGSTNLYSQWSDVTGGIGYASGDVFIGGTLPSAPNVTIAATGAITALVDATINSVIVGRGSGDLDSNTAVGRSALFANTTGTDNIAVGYNSLRKNTTGISNTAVGRSSIFNNLTGNHNTALGGYSLTNLTSGDGNTSIGRGTLTSHLTGNYNTALGRSALGNSTVGDFNIAVGRYALLNLTSGNNNTFIGSYTGETTLSDTISLSAGATEKLRIDSTGSLLFGGTLPSAPNFTIESTGEITTLEDATINGVIIGRGSGDFTTNTALGRSALVANTTGAGNTATGTNSLSNNTEGENNTAVGRSALLANTTGTNSTAVGLNSLSNNTEGSNNTALGVSTLTNSITGDYNTAVGRYALNNLTSGDNNTFIGSYRGEATLSDTVSISAGQTEKLRIDSTGSLLFGGTLPSAPNVTIESTGAITAALDATIHGLTVGLGGGDQPTNTAVGVGSLLFNTTGAENTAVGRFSLYDNTEGSYNTAIGRSALFDNNTGTDNTAVGRTTLFSNTTGDNNTALGKEALYNNSVGSDNTAIGRGAGRYIEGSNNTILGNYEGTTADSTLSDTVIISAGSAEKLRIDSTGSLLFGGTLPSVPNVTIESTGEITALADATINGVIVGLGGSGVASNTAVGFDSLGNNTTGVANTSFGNTSLSNNTEGEKNTAMGGNSMAANTTGTNNTSVGWSALSSNISGNTNVAVGLSTLADCTTASNNTAVGPLAGGDLIDGGKNSVLGSSALRLSTTGSLNSVIGYQAGFYITGSNNTILGAYKGDSGETAISNTIILSAGLAEKLRIDSTGSLLFGGTLPSAPNITLNTDGSAVFEEEILVDSDVKLGHGNGGITTNLALGSSSLITNTTGAFNVAVGSNSLRSNTEGTSNTAVGASSLNKNTTGTGNAAIGNSSLLDNTEGNSNTALGNNALANSITGDDNTALGRSALSNSLTGNYNTAVGRFSLNDLTSGDNNTFIGSYRGEATLSDTVSISAGQTEKLRINSTGSLLFGGTLPSAPNVTIDTTGAITAALDATINGLTVGLGGGDISSNTAVGVSSLLSNTTGAENAAVGGFSLYDNTEGNYNTAIGRSALFANTTGTDNVAVGYNSLRSNTEGTSNTAVGRGAGRYIEGSNNTILGSYEGTTADSTLSDTVIISAGAVEKLRIDSTGSLLFGGTLPGTPNITLNADGTGSFAGKLTSVSTVAGDVGTILATKDYVDSNSGGGSVGIDPVISGMIF